MFSKEKERNTIFSFLKKRCLKAGKRFKFFDMFDGVSGFFVWGSRDKREKEKQIRSVDSWILFERNENKNKKHTQDNLKKKR